MSDHTKINNQMDGRMSQYTNLIDGYYWELHNVSPKGKHWLAEHSDPYVATIHYDGDKRRVRQFHSTTLQAVIEEWVREQVKEIKLLELVMPKKPDYVMKYGMSVLYPSAQKSIIKVVV